MNLLSFGPYSQREKTEMVDLSYVRYSGRSFREMENIPLFLPFFLSFWESRFVTIQIGYDYDKRAGTDWLPHA